MERLSKLLLNQTDNSASTSSSGGNNSSYPFTSLPNSSCVSRASQVNNLQQMQMPDQTADDYEEIECDLQDLLNHYKFHPLNYFMLSDINLLGKTDEFHLYSVFSQELEQKFVLKVINDENLFQSEKRIIDMLEGTLSTLKMNNAFTFEFPDTKGGPKKEKQFYFIFENYKENLVQTMTLRQTAFVHNFNKSQQSQDKNLNSQLSNQIFSESELRTLAFELVEVFADLQRKRIAHRNIKPSNIIRMNHPGEKSLRICNFEWAVELEKKQTSLSSNERNRENVQEYDSSQQSDDGDEDKIQLKIDACSLVYASPLVLQVFTSNQYQQAPRFYNPFKEDVFSLGLTFLQVCLMCSSQQLKELRKNYKTIKDVILNQMRGYSSNLRSLLLIMLREDSERRPEFIQLEQIMKDLFRMDDCKELQMRLIKEFHGSNFNHQSNAKEQNQIVSNNGSELYKNLYQNIEQFLELKRKEVQEQSNSKAASTPSHEQNKFSPQKADCKFSLQSAKLSCPIHDDENFKYFCRQDQEFVCDYCYAERHQDHNLEDLQDKCEFLEQQFKTQLNQTQQVAQYVQMKKSMIRSGKHIDQFFDGLINSILLVHQEVKEQYRQKIDENTLQSQFEKHCKKQESRFKLDHEEINNFMEEERYAETYTNLEYYEDQLRQMDKLKQNMSIYENLLENESDKLNKKDPLELDLLRQDVVDKIKVYINKNL
eukprot:403352312